MVRLKPTELDVIINGVRVGCVTDCGDCWRGLVLVRDRRRRQVLLPDYDTRADAVRGVVAASRGRADHA